MKLGFDLDEVVVDNSTVCVNYLQETYGIEWEKDFFVKFDFLENNFVADPEMNKKIGEDMIRVANDPDYQFSAKPYDNAVKVLQLLKKSGHKIYFITSRPKPNQSHTFRWLRKYDIPFDSLDVIGHGTPKGVYGIKYKLDMFVDDQLRHLESMLNYKSRWRKGLMLMTQPWNLDPIDGSKFLRANDWFDILKNVDMKKR